MYELRTGAFITQEELAHDLDVSIRSVQRWELGQAVPQFSQVRALAARFVVEPGWFFETDDDTNGDSSPIGAAA